MNESDATRFMRRAIALGRRNMRARRGGPFGALIVKDGVVIGQGANRVTSTNDPTAHAEILAIRNACRRLATFDLSGAAIFASCEPCPMCLGAILWARLGRLYYANDRAAAASIGFDDEAFYREVALPPDRRALPTTRLLAEEGALTFVEWQSLPDKVPY